MNVVVGARFSTQSLNSDRSEQAGAIKLVNTETYSLYYTDLYAIYDKALNAWSDMQ